MSFPLSISEVARSLEIQKLGKKLQEEAKAGHTTLELIREPFLRQRQDVGRLIVALGSYDPLSKAHEALFLQGMDTARHKPARTSLDELLVVTSTHHFEKKVDLRKNSAVYDRIHSLEGFASCYENVSLALFNAPLFVTLAPLLQQRYGEEASIYFVVGADLMDKIVDPESYKRHGISGKEALDILLKHSFIVSERSVNTAEGLKVVGLEDLKSKYPQLSQYQDTLLAINLQGDYDGLEIPIPEVSSTLIREKRSQGKNTRSLEAVGISDFVDKRGLYLQNNTKYIAFTYARERFLAQHQGQPIATYIEALMEYLHRLDQDPALQADEIKRAEENKK